MKSNLMHQETRSRIHQERRPDSSRPLDIEREGTMMHRLLGMRPSALVASSRRWLECRCMELRAGIASWTMRFLGHSNVANLSTTKQTNNQQRERETEIKRTWKVGESWNSDWTYGYASRPAWFMAVAQSGAGIPNCWRVVEH